MRHYQTTRAIVFVFIGVILSASAQAGYYVGLSNQQTYTRWYEYPGTYYEEEFSFFGVNGGYQFSSSNFEHFRIHYLGEIGIYPISSVSNWKSDKESAFAVRAALKAQLHYDFTQQFGLITDAAIAYLYGSGSGGMDQEHQDDFGVYLPTIDIGIGAKWMGHNILGADSLSLLYHFSLIDLGIETDNWVSGSPVSENWDNSGLTLNLSYGF